MSPAATLSLLLLIGALVIVVCLMHGMSLFGGRPAALAPTPRPPPPRPYRTPAQVECGMVPLDTYGEAIDDWRREYERANKYLNALEAIATLNQDTTAQRIAKQALGRPWS